MISDADLAALRGWVGTEASGGPTDLELDDAFTRLGTVTLVAEEVLRTRLVGMLAAPLDIDITNDVHEKWDSNVAALRDQVATLEAVNGTTIRDLPPVQFGALRNRSWSRRRCRRWGR